MWHDGNKVVNEPFTVVTFSTSHPTLSPRIPRAVYYGEFVSVTSGAFKDYYTVVTGTTVIMEMKWKSISLGSVAVTMFFMKITCIPGSRMN